MNTTIRLFISFFLLSLPLLSGCEVHTNGTDNEGDGKTNVNPTVLKVKDVEFRFRWCPAGAFTMGSLASEQGRFDNETQHQVKLTKGFWMLETQVTQEMWKSVMDSNPSDFKGSQRPVECVSWNDCQVYIKKLNDLGVAPNGYRFSLPTETQWEYACRAGTTTAYFFGDTLTREQANFGGDQTAEVASYPANAWGLYDMHGNVWEWCADWYGDCPGGTVTDPMGVPSGSNRILRGGSWYYVAECCRSANRGYNVPSLRDSDVGLRLALVPQ